MDIRSEIADLREELHKIDPKTQNSFSSYWDMRVKLSKHLETLAALECQEGNYLDAVKAYVEANDLCSADLFNMRNKENQSNEMQIITDIDPELLFLKGVQAFCGIGILINHGLAKAYLELAAFRDHAGAQSLLGYMLFWGYGGEKNCHTAAMWFTRAAALGHAAAQADLAWMHEILEGEVVSGDFELAAQLYRKSADQGNKYGQDGLGYMLLVGRGVDKNIAEAYDLFRKSAKQENIMATKHLELLEHLYPSSAASLRQQLFLSNSRQLGDEVTVAPPAPAVPDFS